MPLWLRLTLVLALLLGGYVLFFVLLGYALERYFLLTGFGPERAASASQAMALGAEITLKLTLISGLAGLVIGVFAGMFRLSARAWVRLPATFYIWVTRGTPLLVQILFAYNALPLLLQPLWPGAQQALTPYWAAFIALSFNVGAYNAEVVRAGIQAIPKGQWEAAWSLGLSPADTMRFVVLPQALRIVVPPLVNNVVALLKDSSLASAIALTELALSGQRIISATFRPVEVYLAVAAIYLLLTTVLTAFTNRLEVRLRVRTR
ncbi:MULTISPECIES: amino acid ABC transporter permease [Thermus]|jgi:polar amino acid transport system permease protein|uniref:Amino acid ABC transporter permease n=1 Tax=Thermus brockianus TaxID=56956 RepID=A0A1J0LVG3_THEBO|nr:amino acid ABC transporter permease [Thermus brockianus]APD10106.1 amino acid ABC transporter permease [Thermus brockianus]